MQSEARKTKVILTCQGLFLRHVNSTLTVNFRSQCGKICIFSSLRVQSPTPWLILSPHILSSLLLDFTHFSLFIMIQILPSLFLMTIARFNFEKLDLFLMTWFVPPKYGSYRIIFQLNWIIIILIQLLILYDRLSFLHSICIILL